MTQGEKDQTADCTFLGLCCPLAELWVMVKCPKILNTKVSDNMTYANSADPDQTAPEGAV